MRRRGRCAGAEREREATALLPLPLAGEGRGEGRRGQMSERNIVVHVVEAGARLRRRRLAGRRARRRRSGLALFAAAIVGAAALIAAAAFAPTGHLHLLGDDLGGVVFLAFLVGPLPRLQSSFAIDR